MGGNYSNWSLNQEIKIQICTWGGNIILIRVVDAEQRLQYHRNGHGESRYRGCDQQSNYRFMAEPISQIWASTIFVVSSLIPSLFMQVFGWEIFLAHTHLVISQTVTHFLDNLKCYNFHQRRFVQLATSIAQMYLNIIRHL